MRQRIAAAMAIVLSVSTPTIGLPSEAGTFQASQPFDLPNGIAISQVTYIGYYLMEEVATMTCWENRIWIPSEGKSYQENAAFAAGLSVSVTQDPFGSRGDTLHCELDTSRMIGFRPATGARDSTVLVEATVECLKATVGQMSWVKFLNLRVTGHAVYRKFGGVFPLADYRCGPRVRQF